jgi:hypothetical protein
MSGEELDEGLKWRGHASDGEDSDDDVFGLYAEREPYDDVLDDDDSVEDEDSIDPLGGLVTIGNLEAEESEEATEQMPSENDSADFLKQLEDLIERDMPKVKITDEYQKVLDAVDESDGGLVEGGERRAKEAGQQQREEDGPNACLSDDHEGAEDSSLPNLSVLLGNDRRDPEAEVLAELVEGLVVDEDAVREKERRGMFLDDEYAGDDG